MPNVFNIIGDAWTFFNKQPVLNHVVLWLMTLPMAISLSLSWLQDWHPVFKDAETTTAAKEVFLVVSVLLGQLILSLILIWGTACLLVVGKKLLGNSAGRSRSSFRKVRQEAGKFVANIFLTGILRACITILWSILFIIPGIIYALRTYFYQIAIVCEKKEFRGALQQSKTVVAGKTWTVLWYALGLSIILFGPVGLVSSLLIGLVEALDARMIIPIYVIVSGLWSLAGATFTLSTIILYKHLKKMPAPNSVTAVQP